MRWRLTGVSGLKPSVGRCYLHPVCTLGLLQPDKKIARLAQARQGLQACTDARFQLRHSSRAARGEMLSINDVLEILSTPLLGIIPESQEVLRASNVGSPVTLNNPLSAPARAYFDAARRLKGEQVPMVVPSETRGIFNKLFSRKAA